MPQVQNRKPVPLHCDILIIGGSYAGLSALVALKNLLRHGNVPRKVSITLVEPKAGLLNVLGVPRSIVDSEFAKTQYIPLHHLNDLPFDSLISDDDVVWRSLGKTLKPDNNPHVTITYVQGSVKSLTRKDAVYHLNGSTETTASISFEKCVIATGRNRTWPTSPLAYNYESYMDEMRQFNDQVTLCNKIAVVGAGAVGVEIAGDIKSRNRDKEVVLIHPHDNFPPEPLTEAFKDLVKDSLVRSDVKVITGARVTKESPDHTLELSTGDTVKADFVYWCNKLWNNTGLLSDSLGQFVSPANNVCVNEYLQLYHPQTKELVENIFCLGDMVEIPIIKSAGWALYMGRQVANNITGLLVDGTLVEKFPDITQMPRGIVLVAGNEEIVSELLGEVELNHKGYVEEYKDYCIGKIRVTLGA